MNGMGGLFELVIVFAILLGWGFVEWRSARRYRAKTEAERRGDVAHSPDDMTSK